MPRYDVFLEGRAESSTCYFGVAVMADDQKEAEYLGHEAGRKKHRECDEIEVVGVMPVISARNAGKGRLCQRIPLKERALKFVKEAIKNGRSKIDANALHKRIEMNLHASNPFTIEECCYKDALNSVDEAPTIDPESLRGHAKWVKDKELKFIIVDDENNSHEEPAIRCTHCNAKISQSDFDSWVWNFCPVCGFKMEDETEEQHETD